MNTDITNGSAIGASSGHFATGVGSTDDSGTGFQTTPQQPISSIDGDPTETGAIEFRVSRADEVRRRLRLTGSRYTFGNADGCTIRLNDPDLQPMHAVLIREGSRVTVRSNSVPVEVNGRQSTEATLQVGDVLRLGLYEFELLGLSDPTGPPTPRHSYSSTLNRGRTPARRDLPAADEVVWRERMRREVDQWRQRQEDCDRRENRIDEREAEMRARESELWSRSDNLQRRETRVQSQETETFHLYDEFAQRQQDLMRLRDESQDHQQALQSREAEFREQEFEYRRRLAEATAQLDQSKLQADAATQAVSRMREQFDALNAQIEMLSKDQQVTDAKEVHQSEEYKRVRDQLEAAKADAEQGREDTERQRDEAEDRVAELSAEVEALKSTLGVDAEDQLAELEESMRVTEQLRDQVAELQKSVADASDESSQLKADFEQSCNKVQELETLVSESRQRGDEHRDQWATDAEQLRAEVERLSRDLSEANDQLVEVREANQSLNVRLNDVRQERDDACVERDARPTTEAFQALRCELDQANDQLTEIKRQYDEMLERMDQTSQSSSDADEANAASSWASPQEDAAPSWQSRREEEESCDDSRDGDNIEHSNDIPASEDVETSNAWGSAEVLDSPSDTIADPVESEPENLWGSASDKSDSSEPDIGASVFSGSLASALIQDIENEDVEKSDPVNPEGTFVLSEEQTGSEHAVVVDDSVSDDSASPWDDISDQAHEFLDRDEAEFDEPETPIAETSSGSGETAEQIADESAQDDDSIEAYMNRLLRRVQGDGESSEDMVMPDSISVSTSQSSTTSSSSLSPWKRTDTSVSQSHPIDADAPLVPRSQPPERAGDLSAMRDLANSSARSEISRSARVQSRDTQIQAMVSFICSIGALSCNIVAFYFLSGPLLIVAVSMTLVVAFICFREGVHLLGEARRRVESADPDDEFEAEKVE